MNKTSGGPVENGPHCESALPEEKWGKKDPQRGVARGGIHWQQVEYTVRYSSSVGATGWRPTFDGCLPA